jgi:formylglycine-generating enzyme required for sulfatase activity
MSDIFISYAREDLPQAVAIAKALTSEGWSIWGDWCIPAGQSYPNVIEEEIRKARVMLVLWSELSVGREWVVEEAMEGRMLGILVPIVIKPKPFRRPFGFSLRQTVDLSAWAGGVSDTVFRNLCRIIVSRIGPPRSKPFPEKRVNPKDGLTYVWVPPGKFRMGCSPGDKESSTNEKPAHRVMIRRGFWMGQTPVTQEAYQRVIGTNPSHFRGPRLPVETVTWDEAKAYCKAVGMRLPTEAEWEYAARAGSTAVRYGDLDRIAWYSGNSQEQTHEVGGKYGNGFGLYDMLGNVWEWVADYYDGKYYAGSPAGDPSGPSGGQIRVLRGGSWHSILKATRVSCRRRNEPTVRSDRIGFRCAGELR